MNNHPVFIIGVSPRSGTNYLYDILQLHPEVITQDFVMEDHMLFHSSKVRDYTSLTSKKWIQWTSRKGSHDEISQKFFSAIGRGILSFFVDLVDGDVKGRILVKTPHANGLSNVFDFFPEAKVIILVRDGRDVAESAKRTWAKRPFAYFVLRWVLNAKRIHRAIGKFQKEAHGNWLIIKYEELNASPKEKTSSILEFLDLDSSNYPWGKMKSLPVRGSSTWKREENGEVSWQPKSKEKGFKPDGRWESWGVLKKLQFRILGGYSMLTKLGY